MNDKERERLEQEIVELKSLAYRQTKAIIKLHGGEVRTIPVSRGRGRPKGSSAVSAADIMTKHRTLFDASGKHVTQEDLAEEVGLTVEGLQYLLKLYGLGWPLD